ncbi:hypothetical protein Bca4012_041659 [Brassica carinata]
MARLSNFTCHHVHVFQEHSENILLSSEGDVGLAASSGPSVLGDKVDEECAAADPPEISDAQNNRKRCREEGLRGRGVDKETCFPAKTGYLFN